MATRGDDRGSAHDLGGQRDEQRREQPGQVRGREPVEGRDQLRGRVSELLPCRQRVEERVRLQVRLRVRLRVELRVDERVELPV